MKPLAVALETAEDGVCLGDHRAGEGGCRRVGWAGHPLLGDADERDQHLEERVTVTATTSPLPSAIGVST